MLYFYLSYARTDGAEDGFVQTFFRDLSQEVRVRAGSASSEEVGARAEHPSRGSPQVVRALSSCRTFVALCSRPYFSSEACGREWAIFSQRMAALGTRTGQAASPLLPVVWTPTQLPRVATSMNVLNTSLGDGYTKYGLRHLIRVGANRDDYQVFLTALADHIVGLAQSIDLPPYTGPGDFEDIQPAFPGTAATSNWEPPRGEAAEAESDDDQPADLDALLAAPEVHLIVDGSNVTGSVLRGLRPEDRSARLVSGLGEIAARTGAEVTVVFDAPGPAAALPAPPRGVRVLFSSKGSSAEELIQRLVRAERAGRPIVVVSFDRMVAESASRAGTHLVTPEALLRLLESLPLSGTTMDVLRLAGVFAQRAGHIDGLDASMVFLAALAAAHASGQRGVTTAFLSAMADEPQPPIPPEALLRLFGRELGVPELTVDTASDLPDSMYGKLAKLINLASSVAASTAPDDAVHVRHLLAATLLHDPESVENLLRTVLDRGRGELLPLLLDAVRTYAPSDSQEDWQKLLTPAPARAPEIGLAGGIDSDLVDASLGISLDRDYLGTGVWASMLAAVIADAQTPMPLSIGVFGEWGSGKSYFMGLVNGEISRLATSGQPQYLRNIVQINFNAWHYADTNLWASLGDEIFRQLAGPGEDARERRRRLREQLAAESAERQLLDARTQQATAETMRLRAKVREATADRERTAGDLLRAVRRSEVLRTQLNGIWRRLGIADEVEQAQALAEEVSGVRRDADEVRRLLNRPRLWIAAAVGVFALLMLALPSLLPANVGAWVRGGGALGLGGALAAALHAASAARAGGRQLREFVSRLTGDVDAAADARTAREIEHLVEELRRAEATEKVAQAQLDEVVNQVGELARQLSDLMPGRRLYTFIAERAAGQTYAGQLGLISTIRKDFQHLVDLLRDWRDEGAGEQAARPIDRIVLYIDDLDRCRPKQVMEVLQAVHLLLALDLFVVVVGVDPRWLVRSLRSQYREMLDADPAHPVSWEVHPHDYLEKIFNIPFVLPGMATGSLDRMIRGLAGTRTTAFPAPATAAGVAFVPGVHDQPVVDADERDGELTIETGSELAASLAPNPAPPPRPLTDAEMTMLAGLEPLVPTPRDAKRLLNLYRMVRSTRDLSPASRFLGDDGQPGDYQAVAILLGLLISNARLLAPLLDTPPTGTAAGGLTYRVPETTWAEFASGIRPHQADNAWHNAIVGPIPAGDVAALAHLETRLEPASRLVTLPDLAAFQAWAPRIRRFSFALSPLPPG